MTVKTTGEAVADVRREQMLAAAATLIAERGFTETRIADVAARVGASPALVIYYFRTKDNLLTEALRWSESAWYGAVYQMLETTTSFKDRLETLVAWTLLPDAQGELPGDWGLWFDLWAQAFRHAEVKKDRVELDQQWRDADHPRGPGRHRRRRGRPHGRGVVRSDVDVAARRARRPGRPRRPAGRRARAPRRSPSTSPARSSGSPEPTA